MKQLDPAHDITVWERNAPDDTFGFGVVFSDETLGGIENADPVVYRRDGAPVRPLDRHRHRTSTAHAITVGGQGFAAMGRKDLLRLLQERVPPSSASTVRFRTVAPDVDAAPRGLRPRGRRRRRSTRRSAPRTPTSSAPRLDRRRNKYMWLGTDRVFEAFQFFVKQTRVRAPCRSTATRTRDQGSTFIVEMHEDVWRRGRLRRAPRHGVRRPGSATSTPSPGSREIFADELDGHDLLANNSKWLNFTTVRNERWHHGNIVLLGDAAHTAHFSIGSGTKLAMEDALALAACLHEHPTRRGGAGGLRGRAPARWSSPPSARRRPRLEWFENIGMYADQDPDAVLLQPAHPLAAASPTTTCASATAEFARPLDARLRRRSHGAAAPSRPADVPALPASARWS